MPAQRSGQCKRLSHFLCQGAIKENIKYNSVSTKKVWTFKCYKFGKENKEVINMDTKPVHHSDKGTFENSADDNGAVVETDAESEIPSQETEPQTTEKSQVGESISDLKERDVNVVKLTTKDLEDLEKIQEELDSLTSYIPNSLQESNASIHMKHDGLIDDQDHISPTLESNINIEIQNVNSDSAKVTSVGVVVVSRMKSGKMPSPISFVKSPQRIAPAPNTGSNSSIISGSKITIVTATAAVSTPTLSTSIAKPVTIPSSPTKVILKPVVQTMKPSPGIVTNQSSAVVSGIDTSLKQMLPVAGNTVQQIQVPGSKFHYVRLVTAPTSQNASAQGAKQATLIPVTRPSSTSSHDSQNVSSVVSSGAAVRLTLPITPILSAQTQVSSKPVSTPQRMLIPASNVTSVSQVRTSNSIPAMTLRQLPTGTLLQAGSGILMLPAQYNLTQLQQTNQSQSNTIAPAPVVIQSVQPQNILPSPASGSSSNSSTVQQGNFVPVAPATANQIFEQNLSQNILSPLPRHHVNGRSTEVGESRLRKPCNCTKSQCLKLYCDCFANGEFCNHCNCNNCFNNLKHEEERQKAIKACLDRNPLAFHPKIGKGRDGVHERRHTKGCNCKRSGCLKNYCECYEAKILCTNLCKCIGCKNFEDSSERKTLMHLADAAEVRVQQQTAAKTKISSQIQDLPTRPPIISTTGERLPFAFVTQEVVEATCQCLLAQSEDGEKSKMPVSTLERLVLEEFGRCLMQIIEYANRTKVSNT